MKIVKSLHKNGKNFRLFFALLACTMCALFSCGKAENKIDENAIIIEENDTELLFGSFYREPDMWSHTYNPPPDAKSTLKKEAVKWLILDKDEKKKEMLIITKYAIDMLEIDESKLKKDLTWENSNLREYIGGTLYDEMFDENDKKSIVKTRIKDNSANKIDSKIVTEDYMFLLSDEEVKKYNIGNVIATSYASDKGLVRSLGGNNCTWWLRTSAVYSDRLCFVDSNGKVDYEGGKENAKYAIRPAIRVKFDYKSNVDKSKKEDNDKVDKVNGTKSDMSNVSGGVPVGLVGYETTFGKYRFLNNENANIEWIVLDKNEEEHKALIISKYGLEAKNFGSEDGENATWDTSTIRSWLNDEFLNAAFTEDEKKYIYDTNVLAEDNEENGTYDGKSTVDKVFLLSLKEAKKYFSNIKSYCFPAFITNKVNLRDGVSPFEVWWLRTPGGKSGMACTVTMSNNRNRFDSFGRRVSEAHAVRPCMWVKYTDKAFVDVHDDKARLIIGDKDSKVKFGKYHFEAKDEITGLGGSIEDISWIVKYKDEENKKALLVSEYCIDNILYNDTYDMMTWENSYAREWLNYFFYNIAFSTEEKRMIAKTKLSNYNFYSIEDGGNDTEDNVFLLSAEDMIKYFDDDYISELTPYTMFEKNAHYKTSVNDNERRKRHYGNYLLRTPSDNGYQVKTIHSNGYMIDGFEDTIKGASLRPAVWVNYNDEKVNWDKEEMTKEKIATSSDIDNISFVSAKIKNVDSIDLNSYSEEMLIAKNDKLVEMGRYPQIYKIDDEVMKKFRENPGQTPTIKYVTIDDDIKWIVLDYDEKEGKALLFSEKILDGYSYSDSGLNDSWSDSKLRKFLNEEFYNKAFSNDEKNNILTTELRIASNSSFDKVDESSDKMFILSDEDIKHYYPDWKSRIGKMTSYAAKTVPYDDGEKNTGSYWIRGRNQYVSGHSGNMYWEWFRKDISGVRPAMWVKVNKKADDILYKNFITFGRYESLINLMFDKGIDNYDNYPVTDKFKKENIGGLFKKYELNDDEHYSYSIFVDKDKQAIKIYEYYDESFFGDTKMVRELNLMYSLNGDKFVDDIYKP